MQFLFVCLEDEAIGSGLVEDEDKEAKGEEDDDDCEDIMGQREINDELGFEDVIVKVEELDQVDMEAQGALRLIEA